MLTDKEMAELRRWALEKAIEQTPGTPWPEVFQVAKRFMAFMLGFNDPGPYVKPEGEK